MKLWIDDTRTAPDGYVWCKSVDEAKTQIAWIECRNIIARKTNDYPVITIDCIDIDHDAGEFVGFGGDYIKLLDWLEETGRDYPIHIHSMNPVGVENMRAIIRRNGWKEV